VAPERGRVEPELRPLGPEWESALAAFFSALRDAGEHEQFHPHPLDAAAAAQLCAYAGEDLYYVLAEGARVVAYGFLRGWDEGYAVPSLGIAVHPDERGRGLGRALMERLHAAARRRGASAVRLKVYPGNEAAVALYRSLGYELGGEEDGQLVGILRL
jgi:[ribosomal protein S18]-alanine N-acetyltransferase